MNLSYSRNIRVLGHAATFLHFQRAAEGILYEVLAKGEAVDSKTRINAARVQVPPQLSGAIEY